MRYKRALGFLACGAVAITSAAAPNAGPRVGAFAPAAETKSTPLVGLIVTGHRLWTQKLARIDPRTLRPLCGPRIDFGQQSVAWSFSRDRTRLATTFHRRVGENNARTSLRFVDVARMRIASRMSLGRGFVSKLVWLRPDRLLALRYRCCPQASDVLAIDPTTRRPVGGWTTTRAVVASSRLRDGLVLLLAPAGRIGPAELGVVSADGSGRVLPLDRIEAGIELPPEELEGQTPTLHHVEPGLAVDPAANRAYVVAAGGLVAEVDLQSFALRYLSVARPLSLLGRLRNWLEPAAEAKATVGPYRVAEWLGNGIIGITGWDGEEYTNGSGQQFFRQTPAGLALIDVNKSSMRVVDQGADSFSHSGDLLLATGARVDSTTDGPTGMGLAAYGADGRQRFHLLGRKAVSIVQVYRGRAYVAGGGLQIIDLASGRIVGKRTAPLPDLLVEAT